MIHRAQGLALDYLNFDPHGVHKHGLTYTTLSYIKEKNKQINYFNLGSESFQIDPSIATELHGLQRVACWNVLITRPHTLCNSHMFILFS